MTIPGLAGLRDAVAGVAGFLMGVFAEDGAGDPFKDPRWGELDGGAGIGGGATTSGITVTSQRALSHSTFYACLKMISETFARVPAIPYNEGGGAGEDRKRAKDSPYYDALIVRPNRWQTPYWFQQTWIIHKLMSGDFISEIVQDQDEGGYELVPIHPQRREIVEPREDKEGPTYRTWSRSGRVRMLLRDEVLHDPLMSGGEGWKGMSILQAARESLGVGIAAEQFQARFFSKGLTQRGLLIHPRRLTPGRVKEIEERAQGGLAKAGGLLLLEEEMKFYGIAVSPQEGQLLELAERNVGVIARYFGINQAKLGFSKEGYSYASVEQFILDFISSTMDPYFCAGEQELNRTLVVQDGLFCEFLRQALVQADIMTRWRTYAIALTQDVMTKDEIRRLENLPRLEAEAAPRKARLDIAPRDAKAARAAGWQDRWEGKDEDRRRRLALGRHEETDASRSRAWAAAAARAIARREQRFLKSWKPDDGIGVLEDFYQLLARIVANDLAVPEGESLAWAEDRGNALLDGVTAGNGFDRGRFAAAAAKDLVRLALEERHAA